MHLLIFNYLPMAAVSGSNTTDDATRFKILNLPFYPFYSDSEGFCKTISRNHGIFFNSLYDFLPSFLPSFLRTIRSFIRSRYGQFSTFGFGDVQADTEPALE